MTFGAPSELKNILREENSKKNCVTSYYYLFTYRLAFEKSISLKLLAV